MENEVKALNVPLDQAGEMYQYISSPRLLVLLDCLVHSHQFAQDFNANMPLRTALWKAGFMRNRSKPNLLKQETSSLACVLKILFCMYDSAQRRDVWPEVEQRIDAVTAATFDHFSNAGNFDHAFFKLVLLFHFFHLIFRHSVLH